MNALDAMLPGEGWKVTYHSNSETALLSGPGLFGDEIKIRVVVLGALPLSKRWDVLVDAGWTALRNDAARLGPEFAMWWEIQTRGKYERVIPL